MAPRLPCPPAAMNRLVSCGMFVVLLMLSDVGASVAAETATLAPPSFVVGQRFFVQGIQLGAVKG